MTDNQSKELKEFKKAQQDFSKWEYSPEGIHYRFAGFHGFSDNNQEYSFFKALAKLPPAIIDFAENIFFNSGSTGAGAHCLYIKDKKQFPYIAIIYFDPGTWNQPQKNIEEDVAHEIAHAWLKHGLIDSSKKEIAADKLASSWLKRIVKVGNHKMSE